MLASTVKRRICSSCRPSRARRLYSTQLAQAHSPSPQHDNSSSSQPGPSNTSPVTPVEGDTPALKLKSKKKSKRQSIPKPTPKNILEENKVEEFLAEIAASKDVVTLGDLARLRPNRYPHPSTPEYEVEYNKLLDRIQQAFNRKQLIEFGDALEIPRPKQRAKSAFAVQIIEKAWGWPSLTEAQKRRRDWSEVENEFFSLNPPQSFLFLGKDGSDLLALSADYNVHVTFSSNPLGLKVEGLRGALDHLRSHVTSLKEEVDEDLLVLPTETKIPTTLLQRISRLSGAFVEYFRPQEIRISYKRSNARSVIVAKRLAMQASCQASNTAGEPTLYAHVPPGVSTSTNMPISLFPHTYALYPFLSSRTVPWLLDTKGAFRLRKVGEWLGLDPSEDVSKTGGLESGQGRLVDLGENLTDLRQMAQKAFEQNSSSSREVSASLGHVLVPSDRASMIPPLKGSWPLSKALKWLNDNSVKHIFTTSLPTVLLESPPRKREIIHRLVYQALPDSSTPDQPSKILKFELVISPANSEQLDQSREGTTSEQRKESVIHLPFQRRCAVGHETVIDVVLPNRPMDIRFTTFGSSVITDVDWPEELRTYGDAVVNFLQSSEEQSHQPDTPLILQYQGSTFMLRSSSNVRQNQESVTVPGSGYPISAVTESILDLEANQKTTVCQLTCGDVSSDEQWQQFLRGCDYFSSLQKKQVKDPSPTILPIS